MTEKGLFSFLLKRVIIYYLLLAIADIILMSQRWPVLAGLTTGGILGTAHFGINFMFFGKIPFAENKGNRKMFSPVSSVIVFAINQIILLPVLLVSYLAGMAFFEGIVAGILLVPLVLLVNSITEVLKITHNNFE